MPEYGTCRYCKVQVLWAKSAKSGRPVILDREPDPERGNIVIDGLGRTHTFGDHERAVAGAVDLDLDGEPTYIDHHVTCPSWPGRKEPKPPAPDPQGRLI